MRPVYKRPVVRNSIFSYDDEITTDRPAITAFNQNLRSFADLRLICTQWDSVISHIVYREVVIFIDDATNLEGLTVMFKRGADLIRSVVVDGERKRLQSPENSMRYTEAVSTIFHGLHCCTTIQNLECYNDHHTFISRKWLNTMAPRLTSTITSLTIRPTRPYFDLSHALVGLGRTIQTLEILRWGDIDNNSTFHVSAELPKLSKLTLRGGNPRLDRVKKLFSRIRGKGTANKNPLRSLTIIDVGTLSGQDVLSLLSINHIGSQLTSLQLSFNRARGTTFTPAIIKACPRLLEFACTSKLGKSIFEHLPSTLERLELLVTQGDKHIQTLAGPVSTITLDDLTSYMDSGRVCPLRILSIHTPRSLPARSRDILAFNSLCTQLGVDVRWDFIDANWLYW